MAYTTLVTVSGSDQCASTWANAVKANFDALSTSGGGADLIFMPDERIPFITTTVNAALSQVESSGAVPKPSFYILAFDADTDEYAQWHFVMPRSYAGTLVADVYYYMAGANTSDKVVWGVRLAALSDTDTSITAKAFAVTNTQIVTVPDAAGTLDVSSVTLTNADSVAGGDFCVLTVYRDADDGTNDTAAGDANVICVRLTYTMV